MDPIHTALQMMGFGPGDVVNSIQLNQAGSLAAQMLGPPTGRHYKGYVLDDVITPKEKHDMEQTIKVDRIDKKHVLIQVGCTKKIAHNPKEFYQAVIDLAEKHVIGEFWDKKGAAKARESAQGVALKQFEDGRKDPLETKKDPSCK